MQGRVIKSTGNRYIVRKDDGELIVCNIKGNFRIKGIKTTNPLAVGDIVNFEIETKEAGTEVSGLITEIQERRNYIIRKSINLSKQWHIIASNMDQAFLIVTLALPKTSFGFIDRFLVTAEAYHIPTTIIFNKTDLYEDEWQDELKERMALYEKIGYKCIAVSALNKQNTDTLKDLMKDKVTLIAGHSGVGKSTLINAIEPEFDLKVGKISEAHFKGKHTTTFAEMFELSFGGFIIDTPGIKELGIVELEKHELSRYFPEMLAVMNNCKFNTCLHLNEPKCAVIEAVKNGEIPESRYNSYLSILTGEELDKDYKN